MVIARHWDGARLILFWLTAVLGCWLAQWSLQAGTYRGSMEGSQVANLQGLWTPNFATGATLVVVAVIIGSAGATTVSWFAGRKERAAMDLAANSPHRRPLM